MHSVPQQVLIYPLRFEVFVTILVIFCQHWIQDENPGAVTENFALFSELNCCRVFKPDALCMERINPGAGYLAANAFTDN